MISSMIRFHLKWWMDTNHFVTGVPIRPLEPNAFLFTDASHYEFRADETILSWSLDGRPIPAPYQYARNDGHSICTRKSHSIYSPFLCHDIYGQHNSGLLYQQTRRNSLSNLCIEVWKILNWCLEQDKVVRVSYSRQIQIFWQTAYPDWTNLSIQNWHWIKRQRTPYSKCSIVQMWTCLRHDSITNFHCMYVVPDSHALAVDALSMNWNSLHAYVFPSTILISPILAKICQSQCRIVLIAPFWPQRPWFSELLQLLVSAPIGLPLFARLLTQSKGRFLHQNLPLLDLHAWELSNNQSGIKSFRKTLQTLSQNQDVNLLKKYMTQNESYSLIGVIEGRLIRSRPLLQ